MPSEKGKNSLFDSVPSAFTSSLLRWYEENGRSLPWRATGDPYAIWLSEVILQQTRIQQGLSYWERFMRRWPSVQDLASATEDEVLREWQGLGYYSRARNLHKAARQIVLSGTFPSSFNDLRRLSGVGDYTAAAIASFAFGEPVAAVDGNVYRVLSRVFGIDTPINTPSGKKTFTAVANQLLAKDAPAAFNQAMMDFGALQCTPKSPRCATCPMVEMCDACRTHRVDALPAKERRTHIKTRYFSYIFLRHEGRLAVRRRPSGDIWHGLWEPVLVETEEKADERFIAERCAEWGRTVRVAEGLKHVLTHRIILADCYIIDTQSEPSLPEGYVWIDESSFDDYAKPRLVEILSEMLNQ